MDARKATASDIRALGAAVRLGARAVALLASTYAAEGTGCRCAARPLRLLHEDELRALALRALRSDDADSLRLACLELGARREEIVRASAILAQRA